MEDMEQGTSQESETKPKKVDGYHPYLANHINALNQARVKFLPGLQFGDPVWSVLLEVFVSEHIEQSTDPKDLANRLNIPEAICERSIGYLIDQSAIFENANRYSNSILPLQVSENIKSGICAWLDSCAVEAPG
ncbi:MAG: hypothetical protein Pars2KO_01380 [Parasphingorhabdus sp.]